MRHESGRIKKITDPRKWYRSVVKIRIRATEPEERNLGRMKKGMGKEKK